MQARALAAALPEKNVLFAFALSAGHREPDRVVSIDLKKITIGQLRGAVSNAELIGEIFGGTKYEEDVVVMRDALSKELRGYIFEGFVENYPRGVYKGYQIDLADLYK